MTNPGLAVPIWRHAGTEDVVRALETDHRTCRHDKSGNAGRDGVGNGLTTTGEALADQPRDAEDPGLVRERSTPTS